ncbi:MAG: hypothetical protein QXO12_01665 [Candidatus Pacearchaeota archaeon]
MRKLLPLFMLISLVNPNYAQQINIAQTSKNIKATQQQTQRKISIEEIINKISERVEEEIIYNDKEIKVYFSHPKSEEKKFYVKDLSGKNAKEALFTAIIQNLYKKYKKNKEILEEWEEEIRDNYHFNIKVIIAKLNWEFLNFNDCINKVKDFLNNVLYSATPLPTLLNGDIPVLFTVNPEDLFFTYFFQNFEKFKDLNYDIPLTFNDAIDIYNKISQNKENIRSFISLFLIEEYKPICREVTKEWINPYKIANVLKETEGKDKEIIKREWEKKFDKWAKEFLPYYWPHFLFCDEELSQIESYIEKGKDPRIGEFSNKAEMFAFLYSGSQQFGRKHIRDDIIALMTYDIYKKSPFTLPLEDFFRYPEKDERVGYAYKILKDINETINSYELIK